MLFISLCATAIVGTLVARLNAIEERIKQNVPRSIANPPASPNCQRPTHAHNNFTNPPLVNIFLTMPNALFTTATKNFLFSLEVALFTFLLLKQLLLNLSIPFFFFNTNFEILLTVFLQIVSFTLPGSLPFLGKGLIILIKEVIVNYEMMYSYCKCKEIKNYFKQKIKKFYNANLSNLCNNK